MKEKELWKSVGIYKGADLSSYEASTFGNIRSVDRDVNTKMEERGNIGELYYPNIKINIQVICK